MRGTSVALALLLLPLSACLSSEPSTDSLVPDIRSKTLPPGCDGNRTGMLGGAGADTTGPSSVVPCLLRVGAATVEPTVGVASDGTAFYYPFGFMTLGDTEGEILVGRTKDQGATWEALRPMIGPVPTHPYSMDPFLFLDPKTDRLFVENLMLAPPTCGMMALSDDLGETWTHTQSGCGVTDHVTYFAGPARTSTPRGYPHLVYRCGMSGGATASFATSVNCQRTIDGGMTWLPPGTPPFLHGPGIAGDAGCVGGNGDVHVDPEGIVYLARGHCGQPWLAISEDEGMTWTTVQVSDLGMPCGGLCEHDASVGMDADGVLYYGWVADDRLPRVARSLDGGATWDEPTLLSPPEVNEATMFQMVVAGPGRLLLAYVGTTTSPGAPFEGDYDEVLWNGYVAVVNGAATDAPAIETASSNPPEDPIVRGRCGPFRCGPIYDFIDLQMGPDGTPWATFVDGCDQACADSGEVAPGYGEGVIGRLVGPAFSAPEQP